jgi:tRNA (guanine37-N1)-methyltransferase
MQMTTSSSNACRISSDAGIATEIDHAIFTTDITLIALNIPAAMTSTFLQKLKDHTFQRKSFKRVHDVPGHPDRRLLLLGEQYKDIQLHSLPPDLREYLSTTDYRAEEFSLQLTYKHFNVDEVLTRILPEGTEEIPSSFEQAGHIAHLNLRDNMLPYKHLIGQVPQSYELSCAHLCPVCSCKCIKCVFMCTCV